MTRTQIEIKTADGDCPAHVFRPTTPAPWPAVLVFMDGIGMRPALYTIAERIADAGYYVLMPDLFYRMGPYTAPDFKAIITNPAARGEWFGKVSKIATAELVMRDMDAFLAHFDGEDDVIAHKIAITGYCMGGRLSLVAAAHFAERIAAAAAYHPGGLVTDAADSPHKLVDKIKARVYVGAAKEDQSCTIEQQQALDDALTAAGVVHAIEEYDAHHGWVPPDTSVHDPVAAERHFATLFELLGDLPRVHA